MQIENPVLFNADHPVARNLTLKRDLLRANDPEHEKIKTGIFINGGIMLGSFSGGVVTGFENVGMAEVFDWGLGESAGACALAYLLAKQSALGTSIYHEVLALNGFIDFSRLKNIAHIDLLVDVFRGKSEYKKLDVNSLMQSRSNLMVAVTNVTDGQIRYIDIKDPNIDPVTLLHASVAMPIAYNRLVKLMNQFYCDGAIGSGDRINFMIDQLNCTDILVVSHRSLSDEVSAKDTVEKYIEGLLVKLFMREDSKKLRNAFLSYRSRSEKLFNDLLLGSYNRSGVNIALLCMPQHSISRFSMNPYELRWLADQGVAQIEQVFGTLEV